MWCGVVGGVGCGVVWWGGWVGWGRVGGLRWNGEVYGRGMDRIWQGSVMVEVGYGRGRVGSELSQLGSRLFVHACY